MRRKLSAVSFAFTPDPTPVPVPEPAPSGKLDIDVEFQGIVGNVATFAIPAYDLETHNRLERLTVYLVPGTDHVPTAVEEFEASAYPFVPVEVGAINGGTVDVTLPAVEGPHNGRAILDFDA